jgi:pimeloyl-ACP methyl ester carboxylesterase
MIARTCQVITYDLRHHGESGKPPVGFHIARLAADLRDLLTTLNLDNVTVVGASMGAAIIWSYFELFAGERISQAVFVDQAPLQNIAIDWKAGSTGCYDIASLTRLQCRLLTDFKGFARDNALFCAGPGIAPDAMKVLENETLRANPVALAALMADHTALDWRPVLQHIKVPCINIIGRMSAVFPWWGVEEVGKLIPHCKNYFFEQENHWMYLQQPSKFSALIAAFATDSTTGAEKTWTQLHPSISEIVH